MKLLIPTAKIVPSDLQNIGKLPAIIYPVNGGIAFDFLKKKYEGFVSEIDIICYERAAEVKKMLQIYDISTHLKIVELKELGDLGHTIYAGLTESDGEILINFGDTLVMDTLPLYVPDFITYVEDFPDETWSFFEFEDGRITQVCDKKRVTGTEKKPLFVGIFKIHDSTYLKECLEQSFSIMDCQMDSFYYALMLYSKKYRFRDILVEEWLDIGHAKGYFRSKLAVRARAFNHISIDKERGILKKTSEDKEKLIGEIKWYLKLPEDLEYVRPRIFSYSTHYENPYIAMEYYAYHTLHELFLYGDLSYEQWDDIFRHVYFILEDFGRYQLQDSGMPDALREMYLDKTLERMDTLRRDENFQLLFTVPLTINHIMYKSLNEVCEILKQEIPKRLCNHVKQFYMIHGDLCFTNIMVDHNFSFIKLIDPRGKFGKYDLYGDRRYEIAKILHCLDGKYDFIIKNLFVLKQQNRTEFSLKILEPEWEFEIQDIFLHVFEDMIGDHFTEIKLIEALLFLSMVPLHNENLQHQYAMLCTGMMLLDKIIDIKI